MPKRVAEDDEDGVRDPPEVKATRRMVKVSQRFRRNLAAPSSSQAPSPFAGITSNPPSVGSCNTNPFLVTTSSSDISGSSPAKKNRREDVASEDSARSSVGIPFGSAEAPQAPSPFAGIQFNPPSSGSVFQPSAGTSGQSSSGNSNPFSPAPQAPSSFAGIKSNTTSSGLVHWASAGNSNSSLETTSSGIVVPSQSERKRGEETSSVGTAPPKGGFLFGSAPAPQAPSPFAGFKSNRQSSDAVFGSSAGINNSDLVGTSSGIPSQAERKRGEEVTSSGTTSKVGFMFGKAPAPQASSSFAGIKYNPSSDAVSGSSVGSSNPSLVGATSASSGVLVPSQSERNRGEEATSSGTASKVGFTFGKAPSPPVGMKSNPPSTNLVAGLSAGNTSPSSLGATSSGIFNRSQAERNRGEEGASTSTGPLKVGFTFGSASAPQAPSSFTGTKSNTPSSFGTVSSGNAVPSQAESNRWEEAASSGSKSKSGFLFGSAQAPQASSPFVGIKSNPSSSHLFFGSSASNNPDATSRAEGNKGGEASSRTARSMDGPFSTSRSAPSPSPGIKSNSLLSGSVLRAGNTNVSSVGAALSGISGPSQAEKSRANERELAGTAPSKGGLYFGSMAAPALKVPDAKPTLVSGALSISSQSIAVHTTPSRMVESAKRGSLSDEMSRPSEAPFGDGLTAVQGVRLNKMFLSWISHQIATAPEAPFDAGNRDYVAHAAEIKSRVVFSRTETVSEVGSAFKHPSPTTSVSALNASLPKPPPMLNTAPLAVAGATLLSIPAAPAPAPKPAPSPAVSATPVVPAPSIPPAASSGNSFPSLATPTPATTSGFSPILFGASSTSAATGSGALSKNFPPPSTTSSGGGFNFNPVGLARSSFQGKFNDFKVPSGGAPLQPVPLGRATDGAEEAGMPKEDPAKLERAPGEEDEEVVRHFRAKLYLFKKDENTWRDLGVGLLRLMKHKSGGSRRLILRNDMGKVLLNAALYKDMKVTKSKNSINFMANMADGGPTSVMLKVTADEIADLHAMVLKLVPSS